MTFSPSNQGVWEVTGGTPLQGCVRLSGAKNASYKLMIAALLGSQTSRILNLPSINDVEMVKEIINSLGAKAVDRGNKTVFIDPRGLNKSTIAPIYGEVSRASTLFIAPLLHKFGQVEVPLPGGDKIGKRPLDRHLLGLEKMGAKWNIIDNTLTLHCKQLHGVTYRFDKNTHTGTETLLMAAVQAKGRTILENAALEPEVDDLINFFNSLGARIRRRSFKIIEIEGVDQLNGAIYKTMPDRNEAVSYACAALATKGDIIIENARYQDLQAFIDKVEEANGGVEIGDYGIRFFYKGEIRPTDIETNIHPGFMTDWQPLWATFICQAKGASVIHETVSQNRFQYIDQLMKMGANIEFFQPEVKNPEKFYNFNWEDRQPKDVHAIRITGPTIFKGGEYTINDLRAGATILLAAIGGQGKTILYNTQQVERGYEELDDKLVSMGAIIKRIK